MFFSASVLYVVVILRLKIMASIISEAGKVLLLRNPCYLSSA